MTTAAAAIRTRDAMSHQRGNGHDGKDALRTLGGIDTTNAASFRKQRVPPPRLPEDEDMAKEDSSFSIKRTAMILTQGEVLGRHLTRQNTDMRTMAMLEDIQRRTKGSRSRYLVDPRSSKVMPYWDTLTSLAIVFTAFVTPFEVAFLPMATSAADALFLINRCIDVVFILDMIITFRLIYAQGENGDEGIIWIEDPRLIAKHYFRGWFLIDFVSIGVSAVDYVGIGGGDSTGDVSSLRALRAMRALRLIKLARLLRASRIFKRWESKFAINYTALELGKCLAAMLMVAHWLGCLWSLQASLLSTSILGSWIGANDYCIENVTVAEVGICPDGWRCPNDEAGVQCRPEGELYAASVYWSVMTLTSIGYGDIAATKDNAAEQVACTVLMLCGAVLWGYVIGTFVGTIANLAPATQEFRRNMNDLNNFMSANHVEENLRWRLREYFHRTRHLHDASNQKRLLDMMSPRLQTEVILTVNQRWLRGVSFLHNESVEEAFVVGLTLALSPMVLAPFELAPYGFLYILYRGVVTIGGDLLTRGATWGEDIILEGFSPGLRRTMNAKAMNYAETYLLSWDSIAIMLASFPQSAYHVRRCALRLAMRRQLARCANAIKREARREARRIAIENGEDVAALSSFSERDPKEVQSFTKKKSKSMGKILSKSTTACAADMTLQTQLINLRRASSSKVDGFLEASGAYSHTSSASSATSAAAPASTMPTSTTAPAPSASSNSLQLAQLTAVVARQATALEAVVRDMADMRSLLASSSVVATSKKLQA